MQVTLIHLEDQPRPGVIDAIAELQHLGKLRVMMLTGDHDSSAWKVANAVGINEVYYSLKPEDKLAHVKEISREMGETSYSSFHVICLLCKPYFMLIAYIPKFSSHLSFLSR